ncbi:MAG TPA: carboxylating nicotinate-nucleotide diphosphorylase [Acidothermaceae bacterium]|nr:carboxylating nicotinate-nucleotide diphosphorylase [Acidothermaceae bacterium]
MSLPTALGGRLTEAGLDAAAVETLVAAALAEDLAGGVDVTSVAVIPADDEAVADFVSRAHGVVAGVPIASAVLWTATGGVVDIDERVVDGMRVEPGTVVLSAAGATRSLLTAERTALNLLGHLSGIATLTRTWVDAIAGSGASIRDTRKTTPGLRALEKYAVRCGGGVNHRLSLSDVALIKDNHVVAAGGVAAAFHAVRAAFPQVPVEVECDTVEQVGEALEAGADLILLDNMSLEAMRASVALVRERGSSCRLEASGGLTLATAAAVAATGVDYLSVGALTHSAPVLDIGVDLRARSTDAADD